jgi:hypothetical protein
MILWQGNSAFDGSRIAAVLTLRSENVKVGNAPQLWMVRTDVHPCEKGAQDGPCPSTCNGRADRLGFCYVVRMQGPLAIFNRLARNGYPRVDPRTIPGVREIRRETYGRAIRLGAWGDPAAIPVDVLRGLESVGSPMIGYTHAWSTCSPDMARWTMASVESIEQRAAAKALGYRTFRILRPDEQPTRGELLCSAERDQRVQCIRCRGCGGLFGHARDRAIHVHGSRAAALAGRAGAAH